MSEKDPRLLRLTLDRPPGPSSFTFFLISRLEIVGLCRFTTWKDYFFLCPSSIKVVFRNESEEFPLSSRSSSVRIPSSVPLALRNYERWARSEHQLCVLSTCQMWGINRTWLTSALFCIRGLWYYIIIIVYKMTVLGYGLVRLISFSLSSIPFCAGRCTKSLQSLLFSHSLSFSISCQLFRRFMVFLFFTSHLCLVLPCVCFKR